MSITETSIEELRALTKKDLQASNELQVQINKLRQDMANYKDTPLGSVILSEGANRQLTADLVRRIEAIHDRDEVTATDREMLRALNDRLSVCDQKGMKMAELQDLLAEAGGQDPSARHEEENTWLKAEKRRGKQGDESSYTSSKQNAYAPEPVIQPLMEPMLVAEANDEAVGASMAESVADPFDPKVINAALHSTLRANIQHASPRIPVQASTAEAVTQPIDAEDADTQTLDMPLVKTKQPMVNDEDIDAGGQYIGDSEEGEYNEEDESDEEEEPDKTKWPLLYRILDVDPAMNPRFFNFNDECLKSKKRLATKHDPKSVPNDPRAPERWAAILKAYETLTDKDRKNFYDMQGKTPASLEGFDLAMLSLDD